MDSFLLQATIYLAAAVIAIPIAKRIGPGSVPGYLIAGVIIGPVTGLVGNETKDLQHFAEFGVVMMLFIVGLELEPRALWDMRHRLIGLGGLQVSVTTLAITAAFMLFGQVWYIALAVGLTFALSSTAIVVQTLNEKNNADPRRAIRLFGAADTRHRRDPHVGTCAPIGTWGFQKFRQSQGRSVLIKSKSPI